MSSILTENIADFFRRMPEVNESFYRNNGSNHGIFYSLNLKHYERTRKTLTVWMQWCPQGYLVHMNFGEMQIHRREKLSFEEAKEILKRYFTFVILVSVNGWTKTFEVALPEVDEELLTLEVWSEE